MIILLFIGLTPKFDDFIEDFRVEFPTHIKNVVNIDVRKEIRCSRDKNEGNHVPVKMTYGVPKESGVPTFHVLHSTEGYEQGLTSGQDVSDFKSNSQRNFPAVHLTPDTSGYDRLE